MASFPQLPKTRAAQVEWFHALAQGVEAGTLGSGNPALPSQVAEFVAQHLPGHTFPMASSERAFEEAVRALRASERSWNDALAQALIEADEQVRSGLLQEAARGLVAFGSSCPWLSFSEVAKKQAAAFGA